MVMALFPSIPPPSLAKLLSCIKPKFISPSAFALESKRAQVDACSSEQAVERMGEMRSQGAPLKASDLSGKRGKSGGSSLSLYSQSTSSSSSSSSDGKDTIDSHESESPVSWTSLPHTHDACDMKAREDIARVLSANVQDFGIADGVDAEVGSAELADEPNSQVIQAGDAALSGRDANPERGHVELSEATRKILKERWEKLQREFQVQLLVWRDQTMTGVLPIADAERAASMRALMEQAMRYAAEANGVDALAAALRIDEEADNRRLLNSAVKAAAEEIVNIARSSMSAPSDARPAAVDPTEDQASAAGLPRVDAECSELQPRSSQGKSLADAMAAQAQTNSGVPSSIARSAKPQPSAQGKDPARTKAAQIVDGDAQAPGSQGKSPVQAPICPKCNDAEVAAPPSPRQVARAQSVEVAAPPPVDLKRAQTAPAPASKPCCDKCDGPHPTDACPHFRKPREEHKDAWVNLGRKHPKQMGKNGGNVVVRSARCVPQPGDGSCLFHSLCYGLNNMKIFGSLRASELRKELMQFIEEHPQLEMAGDTLEEWIRRDVNSSVLSYTSRMSRGGWGGGIEMAACSLLKKVNVHVYERRWFGGYKRISCFECPQATDKVVNVLYQGGVHYDALVI